jgi:hypothetical protein
MGRRIAHQQPVEEDIGEQRSDEQASRNIHVDPFDHSRRPSALEDRYDVRKHPRRYRGAASHGHA